MSLKNKSFKNPYKLIYLSIITAPYIIFLMSYIMCFGMVLDYNNFLKKSLKFPSNFLHLQTNVLLK